MRVSNWGRYWLVAMAGTNTSRVGRTTPAIRIRLVRFTTLVRRRSSFHCLNPVTAGLLVRLQLQKTALLRFQQQVVKRTETVGALVETRIAALDRLLDHRTPYRLVRIALLGDGFQRFHHQ